MQINLTEEQIDSVFEEVISEKKFAEIAEHFDIDVIVEFCEGKGLNFVEPKFGQAINSYALAALQSALDRGVSPFKIEESLNNLV